MPQNDAALTIPGEGHFYFDITGTATRPTDPRNPDPTLLPEVGHTTRESPLTITKEGGERTTHPTWQNSAARESISPINYRFGFTLLEWTHETYQYYYGQGRIDGDYFGVAKGASVPTQGRMYVRIDDAGAFADFWIPLVSILGDDNVEVDPENLSGFPVGAAVLGSSDFDDLFQIGAKRTENTPPVGG